MPVSSRTVWNGSCESCGKCLADFVGTPSEWLENVVKQKWFLSKRDKLVCMKCIVAHDQVGKVYSEEMNDAISARSHEQNGSPVDPVVVAAERIKLTEQLAYAEELAQRSIPW